MVRIRLDAKNPLCLEVILHLGRVWDEADGQVRIRLDAKKRNTDLSDASPANIWVEL